MGLGRLLPRVGSHGRQQGRRPKGKGPPRPSSPGSQAGEHPWVRVRRQLGQGEPESAAGETAAPLQ